MSSGIHTSDGTTHQFSLSTDTGGTGQRNITSTASSTGYMNGYSTMGGVMAGSYGVIPFKCRGCSTTKNSCEELEIHIKTEHLNWLPFRCLKCHGARASDTQMREHMFSVHKGELNVPLNHYAYIDNPNAKRQLQNMLDQALIDAATVIATKSSFAPRQRTTKFNEDVADMGRATASATITVHPNTSNDILAQLQAARSDDDDPMKNGLASVTEGADDQPGDLDEFPNNQLSRVFGKNPLEKYDDFSTGYADNNDSRTLIENICALLGNETSQSNNTYTTSNEKMVKTHAPRGRRQVNCVSKKRVLGECSRCQKPVTAGARLMHMFYHLGKDYNTYRFKCKFDDCDIEHYRKDQMENHQSKQHGRIDPDMMIDRSRELADMVQQLSMELLGTVGNQPGPTAEKAQILYDNFQKEQVEAATKKRKRYNDEGGEFSANRSYLHASPSTSSQPSPNDNASKLGGEIELNFGNGDEKRNKEFITCLMCNKSTLAKLKGIHILSHLYNDLGVVRFGCKLCAFKHERPQSVASHGRREHNEENCVEDFLGSYDEEIKSISKACFGVEQSFRARKKKKAEDDGKFRGNGLLDDDLQDPKLDENSESSEFSEDPNKVDQKGHFLASIVDFVNPKDF